MIFKIQISIKIEKKIMNKRNGIKSSLGTMKFKEQTKKFLEMKNLEKTKLR